MVGKNGKSMQICKTWSFGRKMLFGKKEITRVQKKEKKEEKNFDILVPTWLRSSFPCIDHDILGCT